MRFNNKNVILPEPLVDNSLRLEAIENSTFAITGGDTYSTLQYSLDNGRSWSNLTTSNVSLNAGEKALVRGKITKNNTGTRTSFKMTGKIAAKGNIMYLYDYENPDITTITYTSAFYGLFYNCNGLFDASELLLPATTLSENCYYQMFYGCKSLTSAPVELPATTLAYQCCDGMFFQCTLLTTTPVLRATTLASRCYSGMFFESSSINKVITYASNISAASALNNWLAGVASTGDFYNLGGASYPSGNSGIPANWTVHTSL